MEKSQVEKRLARIWEGFQNEMRVAGEEIRHKLIKPFCNKTGYKFMSASLWGWSFLDEDGKVYLSEVQLDIENLPDDVPREMIEILNIIPEGYGGRESLGSFVENYDPHGGVKPI